MNKFRFIVMATSFLLLGHIVEAQVPQILNYQGRVSVNGTNFDGTGQFQFALVDGTGTTTYWSNGNNIVSLPVTTGLYSVLLGDTTVTNMAAIPVNVFTNTDVRLRVWFNSGAGLQQLSPDQRFTAVGYALMAANVPNGAITSANIASNTITAANMAPGAGVVPSGAFVLSQTANNGALNAAGFTPFTTNFFASFGTNWTQATAAALWSARYLSPAVVFNGQMWVLGGGAAGSTYFNDVWSSLDGTSWTEATSAASWSARFNFPAVVFNGQMWIMGGYNFSGELNDVWSSSNGTNWTEATSAAPWIIRENSAAVAFNGKMWVLGGDHNGSTLNDVWSSSDGTNWAQVTPAAPWSARYGHRAVVFNGKMWVLGGYNGGYVNDVWSSSDGTNWTEATSAAPWSVRVNLAAVVFNGQMWVYGGSNTSGNFSDVWSTTGATATNSVPVQLGQFYLFQKQ